MFIAAPDAQIEQGDLFTDCPIPILPEPTAAGVNGKVIVPTSRVVVLTQTCDLVQQKAARATVAIVYPAQLMIDRGVLKSQTIRDQIRPGKMYGWYYLPSDDALSLPETVIDLRDLHTLPIGVLNQLVADGKRVARLVTPFREHLAQHFAVTYMRIALPEPYATNP